VRASRSGRAAQRLPISRISAARLRPARCSPHSLQAFLGCPAHGGHNRFSCYGSRFAHEFLSRQVHDIQRHDPMLPWQNLSVRTDELKADIFNRVIGVIRGALVANIGAIVGAMFAVAKPVAH
jgi:hypothetical protein